LNWLITFTKLSASIAKSAEGAVSQDCLTFCAPFIPLCLGKPSDPTDTEIVRASREAKKLRGQAWRCLDNNGNGHVSLAETGKWIQDTLINHLGSKDEGIRIYKAFYASYIRAFLDAADYGADKKVKGTKTATTDDYVQRNEFRLLIAYLCIYATMFDAFAKVDGGGEGTTKDDDRRISKDEWTAALSKGAFKGSPLTGLTQAQSNPQNGAAIFAEMDADGKGMVLLKEFCEYCEKKEAGAKTDMGKLLRAGEDSDDS